MVDDRKRVIILLGGRDLPWALGMVDAILAQPVRIAAIVASTPCDPGVAKAVRHRVGDDCPLVVCRRPGEDDFVKSVLAQGVDLAVSVGFDFVVDPDFLASVRLGTLNTHPAALPLNRGCHHSFWGIMEKTPLGATLHWMDAGLDTGDIIDQELFEDDGRMTAEFIQNRSNQLCIDVLGRNLAAVLAGIAPRRPQGEGTYHSRSAIRDAATLRSGQIVSVDRLFDLCRATACKGNGFFIEKDGHRFLIRIQVEET